MKNSNDTTGNRARELPACTTDRKEKNHLMPVRLRLHINYSSCDKKLAEPSLVVANNNLIG